MDKRHNVFISHHGKDDIHVQQLKQRLKNIGYSIRNSSIDSTKHHPTRPSDAIVARYLRKGISWAGTFICLIGDKTHTRPWVNYEIRQAHLQGKQIVGIYKYGSANSVELPEAMKKYGGAMVGWNSLRNLGDIMAGRSIPVQNPSGNTRGPIYNIIRIQC